MSKRRKKEIVSSGHHPEHHAEHHEKEHHEHHEKMEEHVSESRAGNSSGRTMIYLGFVVIAAVFFAAGFLINSAGVSSAKSGDQLIFIAPPGCTNCAQMEPIARDVAAKLNIPFVKTGFGQQIQNPGFLIVYNNTSTISGVQDEYTFKSQICILTSNSEICNEASKLQPPSNNTQPPPTSIPKSDRPEAHAFIMSYCPYGLQFLKAYVPVMELLGNKADLKVNFVPYTMHGEKEMLENTRMYCIQKEQSDKFTAYLRCYLANNGDYGKCITDAGIDSAKLATCMNVTDAAYNISNTFKSSTSNYPPYVIDQSLAQAYGANGSPTFGINGQPVSVNRAAEAIKEAVCSAFNNPPAECNQQLSSSAEAAGFGPVGAGGGSTGSGAACG